MGKCRGLLWVSCEVPDASQPDSRNFDIALTLMMASLIMSIRKASVSERDQTLTILDAMRQGCGE